MLKETSRTSCGHYFCTSCAIKVQKSKKPCPKCGTTYYNFFPDTERKKYIGALRIYCTNNSKGCAWNGQLRNLQYHIRENSRHGECQFEVVRCRYLTCSVKLTRNALEYHEDKCHLRAYQCKYCGFEETYRTWVLQKYELDHYKYCPGYPVPCPKKCDAAMRIPRRQIEGHLKYYCPLQVIECKLRWTGLY